MPVQNIIGQAPLKKMNKTSTDAADSDSDLEITEEIEPEARPACISISKPEEKRAAFRWDLVDAVWSDRKHAATPEKIRSAVKFVGDRIRGLRDTWKEANDQLKKAENSKQQTDGLKQQVLNYREWMEWGISQILQWGHPSILKRYVLPQPPAFDIARRSYQSNFIDNHVTLRDAIAVFLFILKPGQTTVQSALSVLHKVLAFWQSWSWSRWIRSDSSIPYQPTDVLGNHMLTR